MRPKYIDVILNISFYFFLTVLLLIIWSDEGFFLYSGDNAKSVRYGFMGFFPCLEIIRGSFDIEFVWALKVLPLNIACTFIILYLYKKLFSLRNVF